VYVVVALIPMLPSSMYTPNVIDRLIMTTSVELMANKEAVEETVVEVKAEMSARLLALIRLLRQSISEREAASDVLTMTMTVSCTELKGHDWLSKADGIVTATVGGVVVGETEAIQDDGRFNHFQQALMHPRQKMCAGQLRSLLPILTCSIAFASANNDLPLLPNTHASFLPVFLTLPANPVWETLLTFSSTSNSSVAVTFKVYDAEDDGSYTEKDLLGSAVVAESALQEGKTVKVALLDAKGKALNKGETMLVIEPTIEPIGDAKPLMGMADRR
jgi:hypothetical protein